jgi:hypothetical protein
VALLACVDHQLHLYTNCNYEPVDLYFIGWLTVIFIIVVFTMYCITIREVSALFRAAVLARLPSVDTYQRQFDNPAGVKNNGCNKINFGMNKRKCHLVYSLISFSPLVPNCLLINRRLSMRRPSAPDQRTNPFSILW